MSKFFQCQPYKPRYRVDYTSSWVNSIGIQIFLYMKALDWRNIMPSRPSWTRFRFFFLLPIFGTSGNTLLIYFLLCTNQGSSCTGSHFSHLSRRHHVWLEGSISKRMFLIGKYPKFPISILYPLHELKWGVQLHTFPYTPSCKQSRVKMPYHRKLLRQIKTRNKTTQKIRSV